MAPHNHHTTLEARKEVKVDWSHYAGIGAGGASRFHHYDDEKIYVFPWKQTVIGLTIPLGIIAVLVLWCYYKSKRKERNRYDGEIRNQDRMNKSLRWKTLKKDVAIDMKSRGGESCEKDTAVETLEGVKIQPMEEWTISPTTSTESLAKPQPPTRWQKFTGMFGNKAPEVTKEDAPIIIEKPELQEPAAVRK